MAFEKNRSGSLSALFVAILRHAVICAMGFIFLALSIASSQAQSTANPRVYLPLIMTGSTEVSYPPAPDWLNHVNRYRHQANLPPLSENPDWSTGNRNHARYMVKNDVITHDEDPNNPWYTREGNDAAGSSNLMISTSLNYSYAQAIDLWMQGPFHALGILDPRLQQTGFGMYQEDIGQYKTGAGLDVLRGRSVDLPAGIVFPVLWPGDGQITNLDRYTGHEFPDPLTSCQGYAVPTGLPIILQLEDPSTVDDSRLELDGKSLEHCRFDGTTYTNPDPESQKLGRNVLTSRNAIILIPREPLKSGRYTASVTVNGQPYRWTFSVQPSLSPSALKVQYSQTEEVPGIPLHLDKSWPAMDR